MFRLTIFITAIDLQSVQSIFFPQTNTHKFHTINFNLTSELDAEDFRKNFSTNLCMSDFSR